MWASCKVGYILIRYEPESHSQDFETIFHRNPFNKEDKTWGRTKGHTASHIWRRIQKFPDWPPGARTANGTALCHEVHLYRYSVSESSELSRHNTLCYFSTSVYCLFRYRFSLETFGYTLVCVQLVCSVHRKHNEPSHYSLFITTIVIYVFPVVQSEKWTDKEN
jgi:hypothetical protein